MILALTLPLLPRRNGPSVDSYGYQDLAWCHNGDTTGRRCPAPKKIQRAAGGLLTAQVADGHVMEFLCRVPHGSPKLALPATLPRQVIFIPYSGGLSLTSKLIQTHIRT